mgnify:FL=1
MHCITNGIVTHYNGNTYHADLFKCPRCGAQVIDGFGQPIFDPQKTHYENAPAKFAEIVQL